MLTTWPPKRIQPNLVEISILLGGVSVEFADAVKCIDLLED
jgi:hypothetical protein